MDLKLLCLSSIFLAGFSDASVRVVREPYRGWKQAVRITNGTVDLVVVPEIGRIMFYGFTQKDNLLWEDLSRDGVKAQSQAYQNYGGDKVWYAPQAIWNWPPDKGIDGLKYGLEILPDGVKISSGLGLVLPMKVTREIRMRSAGTEVNITNRLENTGKAQTVSCWQVTQVNNPTVVEMPFVFGGAISSGFNLLQNSEQDAKYHTVQKDKLLIARDPKKSHKFGARGPGTLLAKVNGLGFEIYSRLERGNYPDKNSAQEVYTNPGDAAYVELEHLTPLARLEARQVIIQQVRWKILY